MGGSSQGRGQCRVVGVREEGVCGFVGGGEGSVVYRVDVWQEVRSV